MGFNSAFKGLILGSLFSHLIGAVQIDCTVVPSISFSHSPNQN